MSNSPHAIVLDGSGALFADLSDGDDLTGGGLHLAELHQHSYKKSEWLQRQYLADKVEEAALGHNLVGSKDGHLRKREEGVAVRNERPPCRAQGEGSSLWGACGPRPHTASTAPESAR